MKKILVLGALSLVLSGCADMTAQKEAKYNELSSCTISNSDIANTNLDRESFSKLLSSQAGIAAIESMTEKTKLDTLQIIGWDDATAEKIASCNNSKRVARVQSVNSIFEKMKGATNKVDEKKALIAAYSSWETYVNNLGAEAERNFDEKNSYYKNM